MPVLGQKEACLAKLGHMSAETGTFCHLCMWATIRITSALRQQCDVLKCLEDRQAEKTRVSQDSEPGHIE